MTMPVVYLLDTDTDQATDFDERVLVDAGQEPLVVCEFSGTVEPVDGLPPPVFVGGQLEVNPAWTEDQKSRWILQQRKYSQRRDQERKAAGRKRQEQIAARDREVKIEAETPAVHAPPLVPVPMVMSQSCFRPVGENHDSVRRNLFAPELASLPSHNPLALDITQEPGRMSPSTCSQTSQESSQSNPHSDLVLPYTKRIFDGVTDFATCSDDNTVEYGEGRDSSRGVSPSSAIPTPDAERHVRFSAEVDRVSFDPDSSTLSAGAAAERIARMVFASELTVLPIASSTSRVGIERQDRSFKKKPDASVKPQINLGLTFTAPTSGDILAPPEAPDEELELDDITNIYPWPARIQVPDFRVPDLPPPVNELLSTPARRAREDRLEEESVASGHGTRRMRDGFPAELRLHSAGLERLVTETTRPSPAFRRLATPVVYSSSSDEALTLFELSDAALFNRRVIKKRRTPKKKTVPAMYSRPIGPRQPRLPPYTQTTSKSREVGIQGDKPYGPAGGRTDRRRLTRPKHWKKKQVIRHYKYMQTTQFHTTTPGAA